MIRAERHGGHPMSMVRQDSDKFTLFFYEPHSQNDLVPSSFRKKEKKGTRKTHVGRVPHSNTSITTSRIQQALSTPPDDVHTSGVSTERVLRSPRSQRPHSHGSILRRRSQPWRRRRRAKRKPTKPTRSTSFLRTRTEGGGDNEQM